MVKSYVKVALSTLACIAALSAIVIADDDDDNPIRHVLLLSVDGLHASDLAWYVGRHPASTLAQLSASGRTYTHAMATMPSDSFPGMLAMVTGGTPRSTGVYYDDGYDRTLLAANAICVPGQLAPGTQVQWKQNLDQLPFTSFLSFIDPAKLPFNPVDCSRVYPHKFPRVNNVFELVKAAGGLTAWSDKHPAYEFLNGPSGTGIDDLYTPEIASCLGTLPCAAGGSVITNSFQQTMDYDDMKVAAIVNEIHGLDHSGKAGVGVPAVFGMNFQAVSVGQKLSILSEGVGGYVLDPETGALTPSAPLRTALAHTDESIGKMVTALRDSGLLDSTLIIISAKHGNSPINPAMLVRVDSALIRTMVNSVAPGLALLSADTGPLIWLKDQSTTSRVVDVLNTPANRALAHIDQILWGSTLPDTFADPLTDSRAPDIALVATSGTVYTTALTKIADHGSFSDDDAHVALLVSTPSMKMRTIDDPVETRQIACTILKSLSLGCRGLMSEQIEPSKALPRKNRHYRDDDDGHQDYDHDRDYHDNDYDDHDDYDR